MDVYDEMVMGFVTRDQRTFVIPQFSIGSKGEWSCPDFVAISPTTKQCHIIEVSTAYNLNGLAQKVRNKENQWIEKLGAQFEEMGVTDPSWVYDVWIFIREDRVRWFTAAVQEIPSVTIHAIEKTLTPWNQET